MHPPTHALLGWGFANLLPSLDRRGRALVFFASLVPDLDGVTYFASPRLYLEYHHVLFHNLASALVCAVVAAALATAGSGRLRVAALVFFAFHLHLACDLCGSSGPDGSTWGILYFAPFSSLEVETSWQWGLRSWQNLAITIAGLGWTIWIAVRYGRSPLEAFSLRADAAVVEVLRRRFGAAR